MTPNITITQADQLPCPLIHLDSTQALADWYHHQLLDALRRGEKTICLHCFASLGGDWSPAAGAYAVLRMTADFLYDHPEMEAVQLLCAGEACYQAYRFQWNMWFAQSKPED